VETDVLDRAQAGDGEAFRAVTEPYRRELLVHCYRMLGSLQDAEDALQETLLSAWRGLAEFDRRAALRTWLYRIATNRCLTVLRAAHRRPAKAWDVPGVEPPEPTRLGEVVWLEPCPAAPEARYEQTETVSLAFVTALQLLPPRQVAVLILRDVLDFPADETAAMLDTTVESVKSALKRARAALRQRQAELGARDDQEPAPVAGSAAEQALVGKFVAAWESADVDGLVALLTDDVFIAMPPIPFEYHGPAAVAAFCARLFAAGRRFTLVPTRANGAPAFGAYVLTPARPPTMTPAGLYVLTLSGERIRAITRFEPHVFPAFGLSLGA
jgi:RNA polymerase sigma-70 factor (TIGR02960 family)